MCHRVAVVGNDVSEDSIASIIRVTRIGELRKTLAVTSNRSVQRRNTMLLELLVTANVVSSSPILVTLMMEATLSPQRRFL
jgi:hypothetical protein